MIRRRQDRRRFHGAALKEDTRQKIGVFPHPQRPDQRPEIGGIDLGLHIPPKELAAGILCYLGHVPVHPTVQHDVAELGVPGGIQYGLGLRHRRRQSAGQFVQFSAFHGGFQLRCSDATHIHQHPVRTGTHSGCLQDGLCIVIVVFQLEYVDISGIRRAVTKVSEQLLPGLRQRRVHSLRPGGVQLRIAAVLKKLGDFLIAAGLQQTLHALRRQQRGLHGPDTGGDRQIIRIFDFVSQGMTSPQPNSR